VENVRAMTDFAREYGVYSQQACSDEPAGPPAERGSAPPPLLPRVPAGVCFPWEQKLAEIPAIPGDAALCKRVWEDIDALAYVYIWHMVLSF
jgi:hypothetical protein